MREVPTHAQLLRWLKRHPQARIENGTNHFKVFGPEGQTTVIRKPSGSWHQMRAMLGSLKKIGLDYHAKEHESES